MKPPAVLSMRATMFLDMAKGGYAQAYANEEFGITMSAGRGSRDDPTTQTWMAECLPGQEFDSLKELRAAWPDNEEDDMKVTNEQITERRIIVEASLEELAVLFEATRKGRRTRAEELALSDFGDHLKASDTDLAAMIAIRENAAKAKAKAGEDEEGG